MAAFAVSSLASSLSFKASVAAPLPVSSSPAAPKAAAQPWIVNMACRKNPKKEKAERNKLYARQHRKGGARDNRKRFFKKDDESDKKEYANPFSYYTYDKSGRAVPVSGGVKREE